MRSYSQAEIRDAFRRSSLPDEAWPRFASELEVFPDNRAGFQAAHVAYYMGALLIIGAMGWFVTAAWDTLPGAALTGIGLLYAVTFGAAGVTLWRKDATRVPGGVLATVAICMTPLVVYGIERQVGWWSVGDPGGYTNFHPYIDGSWLLMEAATILVAASILRVVRFPFVTAPAAYALWYMSMDAPALLFQKTWDFHQRCWISVIFGLVMLVVAYFADGESDADFAFWFYLFGLLTFTGGLSLLGGGTQVGKAMYCLIHLALILLSLILQRRAFLVFGALGVMVYVGTEATGFFRNSFSFTVALTLIGIAFLAAGLLYKRNERALTAWLTPLMPQRVRGRHAYQLLR